MVYNIWTHLNFIDLNVVISATAKDVSKPRYETTWGNTTRRNAPVATEQENWGSMEQTSQTIKCPHNRGDFCCICRYGLSPENPGTKTKDLVDDLNQPLQFKLKEGMKILGEHDK